MREFVNIYVVPYIGTWIETFCISVTKTDGIVVPYIGTWIETFNLKSDYMCILVVPYIGTCIGQKLIHVS